MKLIINKLERYGIIKHVELMESEFFPDCIRIIPARNKMTFAMGVRITLLEIFPDDAGCIHSTCAHINKSSLWTKKGVEIV